MPDTIDILAPHAWKTPESYGGFSPVGEYCILSQSRDSSLLERHNFETACKELNAQAYDSGRYGELSDDRPAVYHWRAGHWACGWVEYLMVRPDAPQATLDSAAEIVSRLAGYPILDEDVFSEAEFNAVCDYWECCTVRERYEYIKSADGDGISIFAARRAELPQGASGYLYETLREGL